MDLALSKQLLPPLFYFSVSLCVCDCSGADVRVFVVFCLIDLYFQILRFLSYFLNWSGLELSLSALFCLVFNCSGGP